MRAWIATVLCACLLAGVGAAAGSGLVERFRQDRAGQGEAALRLARQALDRYCRTREPLPVPKSLPPLLRERSAVFVSAMVGGAPRCCMGTLMPREPTLARETIANAADAAAHDRRFPPIRPAELPRLRVIVSIIGASVPITSPSGIDPLHDGLAVRGPRETGVVLPGETDKLATMVAWGRIRAGMKPSQPAQYLRLEVVRFMER